MPTPRGLNRLVGHRTGCRHAGEAGDPLARVAWDTRGLGKGSPRSCLHHPKVDAMVAGDRQRIDDDAAIDADHRQNHGQQEAQAETGEQEPQEIVPNVSVRKVHRCTSRIALAARPSERCIDLGDNLNSLRKALGHLKTGILHAVIERDDTTLQASVFDAPYLPLGAVISGDRRLRHQSGL